MLELKPIPPSPPKQQLTIGGLTAHKAWRVPASLSCDGKDHLTFEESGG